jgi:protein arginine N-methyltransferase 1
MSYSLEEYARMLVEPIRASAYFAALRETVRPGMVVADVGGGPGVLGVYAATLGARRVFLVEPDASVYAARALAVENGVTDRVEVIRARSTDVELPERADVIVSDLRGVTPFHGQHLAAAADMRRRLLAPGGTCIPKRDRVCVALVEDEALYARTVRGWSELPVPLATGSLERLLANRWYRARATPAQQLSAPAPFVTLDYDCPAPPLHARFDAEATRDGTAHGLLLWFDTELVRGIGFSNAPEAPSALYGQAFFPFAPAIPVRQGERLALELRTVLSGDDHAWSWSAVDEHGRGARHASLLGIPLDADALARRAGRAVPRRSLEGEIALAILQAADGGATMDDIAHALSARFGERFPSPQQALDYVTSLETLWER